MLASSSFPGHYVLLVLSAENTREEVFPEFANEFTNVLNNNRFSLPDGSFDIAILETMTLSQLELISMVYWIIHRSSGNVHQRYCPPDDRKYLKLWTDLCNMCSRNSDAGCLVWSDTFSTWYTDMLLYFSVRTVCSEWEQLAGPTNERLLFIISFINVAYAMDSSSFQSNNSKKWVG